MLFKYGVNPILHPILVAKKDLIDEIHLKTVGREAIVTSGNDGKHMSTSLHYKGKAIDLRTKDLHRKLIPKLADALRIGLGKDWDIVVEKTHIHLEYDPK